MKIPASEAILRIISAHGVNVLFGYPGAANTPIYDSIGKTDVKYILMRNEQGAAHAASSMYKMTGKVGVCTATSGPGATNLVTGIANAYMDSVPLIAITGQILSSQVGKDAFQEVDITGITSPVSKHNYLVKNADDIVRVMNEAFYIARTGRPGPVVIDIPIDIQKSVIDYEPDSSIPVVRGYDPTVITDIKAADKLSKAISKAKKPLIVAGGGILLSNACEKLKKFTEHSQIPVVSTLMGIGCLSADHENYLGMIGSHGVKPANLAFNNADLIMFFGARVSDRSVMNPDGLKERAKIAHIDIDPAEHNKNIISDICVLGNVGEVLSHLCESVEKNVSPADWNKLITEYKNSIKPLSIVENGFVNPKYFINELSRQTDGSAVIVTEVGQNQIWAANNYAFKKPNTFLTSGGLGTMGYGLPAAMGAKIADKSALVIAVEGDGSFQMSMPELGAIKQWGVDIKIVLFVNRRLGMVREYQTFNYNSNYQSVDLGEYPHFDKIADAYEIKTHKITANSEVAEAVKAMLTAEGSYLLEVCVDPMESTL